MDKFVAKYKNELEKNPNATNHLNNANLSKKRKNKISNYFKIKTNNNPNQILSIDCSSDDNNDDDIDDDNDDDIQIIQAHIKSRQKKNGKLKQKSLTNFLQNTDKMEQKNEELKNEYLFVSPLMNERHLFEIMELSGIRNNGSKKRLSQLYSRNIANINSDSLYRIYLHSIINDNNLHRLPIGHCFNNLNNYNNNYHVDYISNIKFDKIGSLFCSGSTNGEIGLFDFDKCLLKWNKSIRNKYNNDVIKYELKQGCDFSKVTMNNVLLTKINTGFRIENIEWSENMNDIAVCGHGGGSLNIYDLRRLNNKPKYRLISDIKGHHPLLINKYSKHSTNLMFAGDRMGHTFCWDLNNKTSKPCLRFDQMNNHRFAVKQLHISNDNILLYVIRENGFIQIMDIRKPSHIYKSINLCNNIYNNKTKIDDAIILESMNCALLKLQNNSLVNIHLENETIRKTYSFVEDKENKENDDVINIDFLSKIMQRRMCSFSQYGMPEILITGTYKSEMDIIDMSTELDAYYFEKQDKAKRVKLGLMNNDKFKYENNCNYFQSAKSELIKNEQYKKKIESIDMNSYGLLSKIELSSIMTSCSLHPKLLYIICGTLNNCLEIVACSSNPF